MKVPDSGMPAEDYWNSLLDRRAILDWLDLKQLQLPIVEIGCGYGSFTLPLLERQSQTVFAFDIETELVQQLQLKAEALNLAALLDARCRDVIGTGTGLARASAGLVLLFNLLHSEHNAQLLQEALALLAPGGRIAIIHWRKDIPTPRGPALDVRPDLQQLQLEIAACQNALRHPPALSLQWLAHRPQLGPYHWGVQLQRLADGPA